MSNRKEMLPSNKKLLNEIKNMKKAVSLFTLGGRINGPFGIDKTKYKEVTTIENQIKSLIEESNRFNENFAERGWIAYESLNFEVIKDANQTFLEEGVDAAEKNFLTTIIKKF